MCPLPPPVLCKYLKIPIEATDVDTARVSEVILEGVIVYDVNNGTDHSGGVVSDSIQQGL